MRERRSKKQVAEPKHVAVPHVPVPWSLPVTVDDAPWHFIDASGEAVVVVEEPNAQQIGGRGF